MYKNIHCFSHIGEKQFIFAHRF